MWQNYLRRCDEHSLMRFIVCIDEHEQSLNALRHASTMAEAVNGSLTLVHSAVPAVKEDHGELIQESFEESVSGGHEILERAKKLIPDTVGINTVLLDSDDPIEAVLSYATEEQVDGIFLGHRALNQRQEQLYGSFAKDIISSSSIPVTVVSAGEI